MTVYIAVHYTRDHDTRVVGAADSPGAALDMLREATGRALFLAEADRPPNPNFSLHYSVVDAQGDWVAGVLACEVPALD